MEKGMVKIHKHNILMGLASPKNKHKKALLAGYKHIDGRQHIFIT